MAGFEGLWMRLLGIGLASFSSGKTFLIYSRQSVTHHASVVQDLEN